MDVDIVRCGCPSCEEFFDDAADTVDNLPEGIGDLDERQREFLITILGNWAKRRV